MAQFNVYTDGSYSSNPGIGGWAAACKFSSGVKKYVKGYETQATNNRMELKGAVMGVSAVLKPMSKIVVHTDSEYLITCWAHDDEWLKLETRPNRDLWIQLIQLRDKFHHDISFVKVAGHSGDEMNDFVDKLAKEQVAVARHKLYGG